MEALYLFQPGNLKYDQAANHCCAFFIDEKGRAQGVAKSTAAVWCDVSWKEICTIYTHTCWSKKSAPIDSTRKSQLDHVHSWLPGSCSGRYSSTCPSSSEVEVQRISVPEAHPFAGCQSCNCILIGCPITTHPLTVVLPNWMLRTLPLHLMSDWVSRGFPHQRLLTFEKAVFLRGNQVVPLVV